MIGKPLISDSETCRFHAEMAEFCFKTLSLIFCNKKSCCSYKMNKIAAGTI